MLLVFAISITPTIFFHNWLANHTDSVKTSYDVTKEQVGKKLFHCKCDTLVAESPFTKPVTMVPAQALSIFSTFRVTRTVYLFPAFSAFPTLRGPPVV